tara:strand:- start:3471 stop:4715 length:1245 start_codon:yes stop_codon:yes gene_type:complete
MNNFKYLITFLILTVLSQSISSCKKSDKLENKVMKDKIIDLPPNMKYGFNLNDFIVKKKKIKRGDTFGSILEENFIDYPEVHKILEKIKTQVSVKKLQIGKPYTLLFSKDSIKAPKVFIYQKDIQGYTIVQLRDSIYGLKKNKPVRTVQMEASGKIESSLYQTMLNNGYNEALTYYLSDIYAWTIDFFRLQKGDRFKIIYTEKFVDDTISIGIKNIKAASFEHKGKIIEAYEFQTDSTKGIVDYFDQSAKNLRRAFLKAPVSFGRVSSRYNLKRRISFYGRVKPHKGTDFAAAVGTPIMTTANGTVVKSSYSKGNGNYVTIKHNNKYSTQYLHMRKRKVKVGQYVNQGDVIGWVGMTGYTSGPHVCYRFWKNGRQVDPFKQKLPEAKPISKSLKNKFLTYVKPIKNQLNCIVYN